MCFDNTCITFMLILLQALNEFKDMTALWTNRAHAYNKVEQYDKALTDCDWALRVSSHSTLEI